MNNSLRESYILQLSLFAWEQRKVLDLLELLTDYDANGSFADMAKNINTTDGDGYAWYVRITDLENPKPLSELKYVDESSYEFLKKTELHGGELLMAKRGNIGKVYIFEPRTKYATVAPNMYLLKLNNKVIPHFLYDYFVSEEGNKKLTRLNASSTMGALYKDDVKNIDVIMPSIEEQAMIGNFFQSIGKAKLSIFLSLTRQLLFLAPCLLILPRFFELKGIWISLPVSDSLSFVTSMGVLYMFLREMRRVHHSREA